MRFTGIDLYNFLRAIRRCLQVTEYFTGKKAISHLIDKILGITKWRQHIDNPVVTATLPLVVA